jgi:hypothetical protein
MSAGRRLRAIGITARDAVLEPAAQEFADATAGLNPTLFEHVHPLGTYTLQHPTARPVSSDRSASGFANPFAWAA